MDNLCRSRGSWPVGWLLLMLLYSSSKSMQADAATAYLVHSMQQPFEASNNSFNSFRGILGSLDTYDTIVLTEDYVVRNPQEYVARDQVRLSQDLLVTSPPGQRYQLTFAFLSNIVLMNNKTVTLRDIVVNRGRKTSGQSVPFFSGEGVLELADVVHRRIVCSNVVNATLSTLRNTPRPLGFPGTQEVRLVDYTHRGRLYPDSVHADDVVLFVSPGDVEDAAYYAGYSVVQRNVTRLCDTYVPTAGCNEQCLQQTVEDILAAEAASGGRGQQLVSIVVPAVVVPVVFLAAAAIAAVFWHRRHKAAHDALLQKQQQEQQNKLLHSQLEEGSGGGFLPNGSAYGKGPGRGQLAHHGPGVPVGLLGRGMGIGAVGSIKEVAVGATADNDNRKGWHLMACHTAPEFPEATAKDAITLGVLLGAGSFGRVYRGRWRGLDVAVKVLHHDVNTAASVANEVDLVMSFRHPNITTAYHFLTWNYAQATTDASTTSGSYAARATPDQVAVAAAAAAMAAAAAATAAGSSAAAGPPTPSSLRQGSARPSADLTSSGEHHLSTGSGAQRTGLSVIQSQSAGSSALATSSAGGSGVQVLHSQQAAATAASAAAAGAAAGVVSAAGAPASGASQDAEALQRTAASHSSGSGMRVDSSSSNLGKVKPVTHVPLFGHIPLLHTLDSPQASPSAVPHAGSTAAAVAGSTTTAAVGVSGSATAAAAATGRSIPQISNANTASASAAARGTPASAVHSSGSSPPGHTAVAAGALSPDAASSGPSWTPSRLMPIWGNALLGSPGQIVSGWNTTGSSVGAHWQQSSAWANREQQQQQQQQQQPLQQEFVAMVPYGMSQPGSQASSHPGGSQVHPQQQQQQQRYVALMDASTDHAQQQQQRETSGTSIPSSTSAVQLSGQLRQQQLQRTARFDPSSGGGSSGYLGGGRAHSGEAQTWLILEYCDGGTVLDLMQEGMLFRVDTGQVNVAHVLSVLGDVAAGMNYLHLRNCVHGDLKPANVLLKKQQGAPFGHLAKVSDFGLSKSLTAGQSHRSTRTLGTFNRAPPELLRSGRLSPACDVYAFGVMIWELFTGDVAFSGLHYGEVFERVALLQERPPIPQDMPEELSALMVSCWGPDPLARPTFRMIQQSIADILRTLPDSAERYVSDL